MTNLRENSWIRLRILLLMDLVNKGKPIVFINTECSIEELEKKIGNLFNETVNKICGGDKK